MKKSEFQIVKRIPFLFLVLLISFSNKLVYSQKNLKYKDVFKTIEEKSKEDAYSILLVYQKQDPFFANTYFQLGILAQFWSKDYDALTNLHDVEFFIYNTNLYYGLALSKIDQKEIRKNDKFYLNIDRFKGKEELNFDEVKSYIQEQIDANNEYNKNVQIVAKLFNSSIKHYNNCIRIFKEINTNNNKIKDIYLTANEKFIANLSELEKSFDSTIYYLQNYQTAIKNYPIKNYNQKYKLFPIETYRLHGITSSDFLKDEISIWNYGVWVKNFKQVLNTDIQDMRSQISAADLKLNENISKLSESREYKSDYPHFKVEEKLKYKIGKYDFKSILLDLFNFKENKINFLADLKDPINNPKDTLTKYTLLQKARYYETLLNSKKYCDSLNKSLNDNINSYDINKYSNFFTMNYGGESGLKNYLKNEASFFKSQLKSSHQNLKEFLINSAKIKEITIDSIRYKNNLIEICKENFNFDSAATDRCYVKDFQVNSAGDYYLTGFIKEGNNPFQTFIAKTNKKTDIKWLKFIPATPAINSTGWFVQAKDDGCELLIHTFTEPAGQNQILIFDSDGKQKDKFDLGFSAIPRYFMYDEINQKYLIIYKGNKQNLSEATNDDLIVAQYDGILKKEIWNKVLKLKGSFLDVVTMNQNLFVITNFTEYQSDLGYTSSSAGKSIGKTNTMIFIFDQSGNVSKEIPILNDNPFYISNSVKINSNTLNLLGFRSELSDFKNIPNSNYGELVYLLLDADGNLYFDNSKF